MLLARIITPNAAARTFHTIDLGGHSTPSRQTSADPFFLDGRSIVQVWSSTIRAIGHATPKAFRAQLQGMPAKLAPKNGFQAVFQLAAPTDGANTKGALPRSLRAPAPTRPRLGRCLAAEGRGER